MECFSAWSSGSSFFRRPPEALAGIGASFGSRRRCPLPPPGTGMASSAVPPAKKSRETTAYWVGVRVCHDSAPPGWQQAAAAAIDTRLTRTTPAGLHGVDGVCVFGLTGGDGSMPVMLVSSTGTMHKHQQDKKVHGWLGKDPLCACAPTRPSASSLAELLEQEAAGGRPVLASLNGTDHCLGVMRRAMARLRRRSPGRHRPLRIQTRICPGARSRRNRRRHRRWGWGWPWRMVVAAMAAAAWVVVAIAGVPMGVAMAAAARAILARLRAVAASTSAQQGRYPAGELTASTAQLDTLSVSHAVAGRVQALAQYSRQPANRPEGLAGAVQPPVALEVAARVAALRQILTSDPGVSPADSDKGRAQPHDLGSVAVSEPDPYATPNNGADRVPDTHQLSLELGPGQAPPSHSTAASSGRPSQAPSGGERSALPLLLTLTNPEATTAPEAAWGGDPNPDIRGPLTQASVSPEPGGEPPLRRLCHRSSRSMHNLASPKIWQQVAACPPSRQAVTLDQERIFDV